MNFGDNFDQMSASSKNSFQRDSNYKSNKKPFKPTFEKTNTDDKLVENGPASATTKDKKGENEQEDTLLVTKL